jgi:hypothetical protein
MKFSRFCAPSQSSADRLGIVRFSIGSFLLISMCGNLQVAFAAQSLFKLDNRKVSSPKTLEFRKRLDEASGAIVPVIDPAKVDIYAGSELEELNSYAEQFKKRLDIKAEKTQGHWKSVPFRHKLWLYTIDKEKFLGNCSVARLGYDKEPDEKLKITPGFTYYLVLMHFNIPAVKATTIPLKYGFARFEAKIACQGSRDGKTAKRDALEYFGISESAEILSVYPENAILPIDRKDTTTVTLTAQPEWMGASGGKGEYSRAIEDSYAYKLPHVVGVGTRFGDVSWTFYPAKAQPIMLGSQSTFAVIKVPYKTESLRILANLRYQLQALKVVTFPPFRVCDWCDLDLKSAGSFDDMAAIQYFGLPSDAREALQTAFGKGAIEHNMKYYGGQSSDRDILVDEKTGEAYGFTDSCKYKKYKIKEE